MKVLYCGSFNPFHIGHEYIYKTACDIFGKDNVTIGIGINERKKNVCDLKRHIIPITRNVVEYDGLTADYARANGYNILVRGIRPGMSLEQEEDLAYWNLKLAGIKTIFIPSSPELSNISSSAIRVLSSHARLPDNLVNPYSLERWKRLPDIETIGDAGYDYIHVIFGKSCCGKTTWVKDNYNDIIEADKQIWKYIKAEPIQIENYKKQFRAYFNKDKVSQFKLLCLEVGELVDWERFFDNYDCYNGDDSIVYDCPAIGNYFETIPMNILAQLHLIKVSTSAKNRIKFAKNRGLDEKWVEKIDQFYQEPPFFDREVIIK